MRLHRLFDHFRRQDWTAVLLDFVITVLGVFVGLQAANLNEERLERQRAHSYLERIHDDLATDLATYRDRLAFWGVVLDYGRTTSPTYDELKAGGELSLIGDLQLRNALAHYYTYAGNPTLTERPAYRIHVRGIIPLDVQTYIWTHCYRTVGDGQQLVDCASPISEARAAEIVNTLRGDRVLMQELRYWMSTMTVTRALGVDRQHGATTLAAEVQTAL